MTAAASTKFEGASQAQLDAAWSFIRYHKRIKRLRDEVDAIAQDDSLALGLKRIQIKELEAEGKAIYDEVVRANGERVKEAARGAAR